MQNAQSPVVGTILMVVITVLLASIFASVVLPISTKLSVVLITSIDVSVGDITADTLILKHRGGDMIDLSEVKIVVLNASRTQIWSPASSESHPFDLGERMLLDLSEPGEGVEHPFGVSLNPTEEMDNYEDIIPGDTITVQLFYIPNGRLISTTSVRV
jgi:flagellin-like protein